MAMLMSGQGDEVDILGNGSLVKLLSFDVQPELRWRLSCDPATESDMPTLSRNRF